MTLFVSGSLLPVSVSQLFLSSAPYRGMTDSHFIRIGPCSPQLVRIPALLPTMRLYLKVTDENVSSTYGNSISPSYLIGRQTFKQVNM